MSEAFIIPDSIMGQAGMMASAPPKEKRHPLKTVTTPIKNASAATGEFFHRVAERSEAWVDRHPRTKAVLSIMGAAALWGLAFGVGYVIALLVVVGLLSLIGLAFA